MDIFKFKNSIFKIIFKCLSLLFTPLTWLNIYVFKFIFKFMSFLICSNKDEYNKQIKEVLNTDELISMWLNGVFILIEILSIIAFLSK